MQDVLGDLNSWDVCVIIYCVLLYGAYLDAIYHKIMPKENTSAFYVY